MAESKNPAAEVTEIEGELDASAPQMAILNGMLPCGFRFELFETARKSATMEPHSGKRTKTVCVPPSLIP